MHDSMPRRHLSEPHDPNLVPKVIERLRVMKVIKRYKFQYHYIGSGREHPRRRYYVLSLKSNA